MTQAGQTGAPEHWNAVQNHRAGREWSLAPHSTSRMEEPCSEVPKLLQLSCSQVLVGGLFLGHFLSDRAWRHLWEASVP